MKRYTDFLNENTAISNIPDVVELKTKDGKYEDSVFLHFAIKVRQILTNLHNENKSPQLIEFKPGDKYISDTNNVVVVADDQKDVQPNSVKVYKEKDDSKKTFAISKKALRKKADKEVVKPEEQKPDEQKLLSPPK